MRNLQSMLRSIRNKSIPAIAAVLLYVLPNLLQDLHRFTGHHEHSYSIHAFAGQQIHHLVDKCPVCIYEFYSADETKYNFYAVVLPAGNFVFCENTSHQLPFKVFDFSRLRAPPVS